MLFDESMRKALEDAAAAARAAATAATVTRAIDNDDVASASTSTSTSTSASPLSKLARSAAFFETLALLCRRAPPSEVFRAAEAAACEEEEEGRFDGEDEDLPRPQRTLLAALAASSSLLLLRTGGGGSRGGRRSRGGYESRVLQEFAKRSAVVGDRLAEALALSLVDDDAGEGEEEGGEGGEEREEEGTQLQVFFFGFDLDESDDDDDDDDDDEKEEQRNKDATTTKKKKKTKPTLDNTAAFPVVASSSRDLLSGGTGKALWPASRALASALLSRRFELAVSTSSSSRFRRGGGGGGKEGGKGAGKSHGGTSEREATVIVELGAGVGLVGAALSVGEAWWRRRRREEEEEEKEEQNGDENEHGDENGDDENNEDENDESGDDGSPPFSSLWLTDGDADAVRNSRRTLEANGIRLDDRGPATSLRRRIRVSRLGWGEAGEGEKKEEGERKTEEDVLVVGSDITYDPASARSLAHCLRSLLSKPRASTSSSEEGVRESSSSSSSRAVLAGVVRSDATAAAFERAFRDAGLSFSCGPRPPAPPFSAVDKGEKKKTKKSSCSRRKVRAWHAGDEGVELRWWLVTSGT